jgi:hypothetical protein
MKLKNKTLIRKEVISRLGTPFIFNYLSINHLGKWEILDKGVVNAGDYRIRLSEFKSNPFGDTQKQITATIKRVEKEAGEHFASLKQ